MTDTRDKFEAWAKPYYKEQQMSLNSAEHFARPNEYMMTHYQSAYEGWQAATEQSQKEIAEKDAMIAEYDRLMSIDDTRIVLLQHNIVELKAREKVLVEALEHYEPVISAIDNSKGFVARQALANVRGE